MDYSIIGKNKKDVVEITTFRSESEYKDNRHPEKIEWAKTIEEDLSRRDCTINAIATDGKDIIDPYNGREDITKKLIQTVGNPDDRFKEDALRMMRAVRIAAQLGFFIEELEPQVRQAILELNKKGYSTDSSGFMNNSCDQMIEGDFQLDEKTTKKLSEIGVQVETNPSGYTRLQFSPQEANLSKIKRQWVKIISLIPNKNEIASVSMTRNAREFRSEYP